MNNTIKADPTKLPTIICSTPECGGYYFVPKMLLKRISKFLSGTSENQEAQTIIYVCEKCGEPLDKYRPLLNDIKKE